LEEFDVGGIRAGGAQLEVGGDAEAAAAVVGGERFVVQLGVGGDFFEAAETGGDTGVGLENVVAVLVDQQAEFVETDVVFAARDRNVGRGGEAAEIVEFEATEGFFHPGNVERGKFATGGECTVVTPDEIVFAAGGAGFLGLIGIDHDLHAVADGGAHGFDLGDVFVDRWGVEAEFDRAVTKVEEAEGIFGALFGRAEFDEAGVGADAVFVETPEFGEGEVGGFADQVPEGDLDATGDWDASRAAPIDDDAEEFFDRERVTTDQARCDSVADKLRRPLASAKACDAFVGFDAVDRGRFLSPERSR
jgi:hypothetical protein